MIHKLQQVFVASDPCECSGLALYESHQDVKQLKKLNTPGRPAIINGIPLYFQASIRRRFVPDGQSIEEILKNSFPGAQRSKHQPYQVSSGSGKTGNSHLAGPIPGHILNHEIDFHYQPIVRGNGKVCSLEALVMASRKGCIIPPDHFIPDLEFTRIANSLTYYHWKPTWHVWKSFSKPDLTWISHDQYFHHNLFQVDFASQMIEIIRKRIPFRPSSGAGNHRKGFWQMTRNA